MEKLTPNTFLPVALVVDDEPLIRMDVADIVAEEGYSVIEARSADEAVTLLKLHPSLELIITDIQMPGKMDGIELARHVDEHWHNICIIVASAMSAPPEGLLPEKAAFVAKPISHRMVQNTIREFYNTAV
jgi:CheY-like chemotaxis protein